MKKETLLGFAILLAGFWFFNSEMYYQMIGQPYPFDRQEQIARQAQMQELLRDTVRKTDIIIKEEATNAQISQEAQIDLSQEKEEVISPPQEIILENEAMRLRISETGARITSALALQFTYGRGLEREGEIVEMISDVSVGILSSAIGGYDLSNARFFYDEENSSNERAEFRTTLNGEEVRKIFELSGDSSHIIRFRKESALLARETGYVMLNGGVGESETDDGVSLPFSERYVTVSSERNNAERIMLKKVESVEKTGIFDWVAINSKYFMFAVIPQERTNRDLLVSSFVINNRARIEAVNLDYQIELSKKPPRGASAQGESFVEYDVFIGPARHSDLATAGVGLERTLFRGYAWFFAAHLWFPPLCEGVLWFLNFFGKLIGDYGVSILLLTLLLKIVTFPLSQASINSMAAMQVLQPKIQEIQKKYAENKQLMQQKILELYQSEGINPLASLGGCIPLLLQMPIMIALFIVLRRAVELRGEATFFLPWISDLSQAEILFRLPFEIPFYGDNFALLPIAMAALMFFQNKMTIKDPNQVAMIYLMPAVMLVMFNNFPAGLTLYFAFSSLLQIVQQKFFVKKPAPAVAKNQEVSRIKAAPYKSEKTHKTQEVARIKK